MMRPRVLLGLCAAGTARALLAPAVARRAAPLHVIETDSDTEKEIFSETTSISGALAELWQVLANPPPPGDFRAMYFPQCEGLKRPQTFQALFDTSRSAKTSQNFGPTSSEACGHRVRPRPASIYYVAASTMREFGASRGLVFTHPTLILARGYARPW